MYHWSLIATIKTFYIFYSIILAEEALEWSHCSTDWTKQKDLITHQQAPLWYETEAATVTILMLFDHRSIVCGLLRATPVSQTKHLHKKEFNWTIALCLISLSELHWCKPGSSSSSSSSHTVTPVSSLFPPSCTLADGTPNTSPLSKVINYNLIL